VEIVPIHPDIWKYVKKRGLDSKLEKQLELLKNNPKYPGLRVELLIPKEAGIYSFRLDRKYRGLFVFRKDIVAIEVLAVTDHYQ
jgi:plasmid maintenance system killer protein